MKTLGELGISPWPWRYMGYYNLKNGECIPLGEVKSADGNKLCYDIPRKNAHIVSAAPNMYEALWDLLFGDIGTVNCRKCKGAELGNCKTCRLGKARFALEKAEGEVYFDSNTESDYFADAVE